MAEHVHAIGVEEWMMSNDQSSVKDSHAARPLLLTNCGGSRCFELLINAEFGVEGKNFAFTLEKYWATLVQGSGTLGLQVGTGGHVEYDKTFDVLTDGINHPIEGRHVLPTPSGSVDLKATFTFIPKDGDVTVVVAGRTLAHPWPLSESLESLARTLKGST